MELKFFRFTEEVLDMLDGLREDLTDASREIQSFFKRLLKENHEGYLYINSRVKSRESLKGKIFRDDYYKRFDTPKRVLDNLSDLIGIRIECRFNEDEKNIYEILEANLDQNKEGPYYYNEDHPHILLDLESAQPQMQNNGFEIYKIDGLYVIDQDTYNFELQIKSLVNVFWSEIEHEIIYKNNDYLLWDDFYEKILGSIKQNLSMMDKQLKILDEHFNKVRTKDLESRKLELEMTLSKMVYTMFSEKMKDSIGFIVDFNKSCDSIVKYIFKAQGADSLEQYKRTFAKTFSLLNDIEKNEIDFKKDLLIERDPVFVNSFTERMGNKILENLEKDFDWIIFFRILFEIEPGNNVEDFETYLEFLKYRFIVNSKFKEIEKRFGEEARKYLTDRILDRVYDNFVKINDLSYLYDDSLEQIGDIISHTLDIFLVEFEDIDAFYEEGEEFFKIMDIQILAYFDYEIPIGEIRKIISFLNDYSRRKFHIKDIVKKFINEYSDPYIEASKVIKIFDFISKEPK